MTIDQIVAAIALLDTSRDYTPEEWGHLIDSADGLLREAGAK